MARLTGNYRRGNERVAREHPRNRYAFDRAASGGEIIESGNEIDTAPPFMGSVRWLYQPRYNAARAPLQQSAKIQRARRTNRIYISKKSSKNDQTNKINQQ